MEITHYDTYRNDDYQDILFGINNNEQPTPWMRRLGIKTWHYWFYDIESLPDLFMFTLIDVKNHHYLCFYAENKQPQFTVKEHQHEIITHMKQVNPTMCNYHDSDFEFYCLNELNDKGAKLLYAILPNMYDHIEYNSQTNNICWNKQRSQEINISMPLLYALEPNDSLMKETVFQDKYVSYRIAKYIGFNSNVYDISMLTALRCNIDDRCMDANTMYQTNESLFRAEKDNNNMLSYIFQHENLKQLRKSWLSTNRFIDVFQNRIGLKNTAAAIGRTIKENSHLGKNDDQINTVDDLTDLFAYNACDIYNTAKVYQLPETQTTLNTKQRLLNMFPGLTFTKAAIKKKKAMQYDPKKPKELPIMMIDGITHEQYREHYNQINPIRVYTINDTPPTLATAVVAPFDKLKDDQHVRFIYPRTDESMNDDSRKLYQHNLQSINATSINELMTYDNNNDDDNDKKANKEALRRQFATYQGEPEKNKDEYDFGKFNVLNETLNYANRRDHEYFADHLDKNGHGPIYNEIKPVCDYYHDISQNNYNDTAVVDSKYKPYIQNKSLSSITKEYQERGDLMVQYIKPNHYHEPIKSDCYCKFSYGGLHGAQFNQRKYQHDNLCYQYRDQFNAYRQQHPKLKAKDVTDEMLTEDIKLLDFINRTNDGKQRWLTKTQLANMANWYSTTGSNIGKVKPQYLYISDNQNYANCICAHNDFSSYYPTLCILMRIYYHDKGADTPLAGYDLYYEIYKMRLHYKEISKDKSQPEATRKHAKAIANAFKLVINSLTGKSDSNQNSNVRLNNKIIAMRCIGQLLTWRIGQELALHGYDNISTNTDGIYSYVPEQANIQQTVQHIIDETTKTMYINVKTEMINTFISKDSNNRLELQLTNKRFPIARTVKTPYFAPITIDANSGSSLAALNGNNVTKTTSHPSMIDTILGLYLTIKPSAVNNDYDEQLVTELLNQQRQGLLSDKLSTATKREIINRFAWTLRGNNSKQRILYLNDQIPLQRINRILLIKHNDQPQTINLHVTKEDQDQNTITSIAKYPGLDPQQNVKLINTNLNECFQSQQAFTTIANIIDINAYEQLVHKSFLNWHNN